MQLTQSRIGKVDVDYRGVIAKSTLRSTKNTYIRNYSPTTLKKTFNETSISNYPAVAPPADKTSP
jgi:hypothetical protein